MNKERRNSKYPTRGQKQKLIEFMIKHPELIAGKVTPSFTRRDAQRLWQVIANECNSIPLGARKSWTQWKKTWQDIRSKTKHSKRQAEANFELLALGIKSMDQSDFQEPTEFVSLEDNSQEVFIEEISGSLCEQDSPAERKIKEVRRISKYPTRRQKQKLIEFMTKHPELIAGKITPNFTRRDAQRLWQVLTNECNAIPLGARKSWMQWKKTWQDMRSKTKHSKRQAEANFELLALGLKAMDQSDVQEPTEIVPLEDNSQEVFIEELSGSLCEQDSPVEIKIKKVRRNSKYPSRRQKQNLIEFMTKHPELIAGKVTPSFTRRDAHRLWQVIANECNSIPLGAKKSWRQWKKTWQDMRSNMKHKQAGVNVELDVGLKTMDQSDESKMIQEPTEFVPLEDNSQEVFIEELSGSLSEQDSPAEIKTWQNMDSNMKHRQAEANGELLVSAARLTNAEYEAPVLNAMDQSDFQEPTECVPLEDNSQAFTEESSGSLSEQDSPAETKVFSSSPVQHKPQDNDMPSAKHTCYFNCDLMAAQEQRKVQIKEDYLNFKKDYLRQKLALLKEQTEALKSIANKL